MLAYTHATPPNKSIVAPSVVAVRPMPCKVVSAVRLTLNCTSAASVVLPQDGSSMLNAITKCVAHTTEHAGTNHIM
jgi:hypothetical protein